MDRAALLAAVRVQLGRFFGKRGGSVVDANLEVIAEAWDGLIDVTAAIGAGGAGTAGDAGDAGHATALPPTPAEPALQGAPR
jgi:hypothetical protein